MILRCCTPARAAFPCQSTGDHTSGALNGIFQPSGCTAGNTTVHPERAAGGGNGCYAEVRITSATLQAQSQHIVQEDGRTLMAPAAPWLPRGPHRRSFWLLSSIPSMPPCALPWKPEGPANASSRLRTTNLTTSARSLTSNLQVTGRPKVKELRTTPLCTQGACQAITRYVSL